MTLDKYLEANEITSTEFADKINKSVSYVSKVRSFKTVPSLYAAFIISKATKGKVSLIELLAVKKLNDQLRELNLPTIQ